MNDSRFDAKLVAATKRRSDDTNTFVLTTMQKIKASSPQKPTRTSWLFQLHRPAIALAAFVALVVLSGAVYAAVHFAPALIQLLGKETNPRGATEYSASGFAACAAHKDGPIASRFEIKSDAPKMSDEEVQKILQAKCELTWLEAFPEKQWPKQTQDNTVNYARLDQLGTLKNLSVQAYTIQPDGAEPKTYQAMDKEHIKAFAQGKEVALSELHDGDAVFAIARYSESTNSWTPGSTTPPAQPRFLGALGVFKMSLPLEYYLQKQGYITEVPVCIGNENELCPQTASVDVYPRGSGEGSRNPYLVEPANPVFREISGEVTALTDDSLTLKSRSGQLYAVTVGDAGLKVYNRDFTDAYTQSDIDAHLKVGSRVAVRYVQSKDADRTNLSKEQVQMVTLQLESLNVKKGDVKQY